MSSLVWTAGVVALSAYLMKRKISVSQTALTYHQATSEGKGNISTNDIRTAQKEGPNVDEVRTVNNQNKIPSTTNFKAEAAQYEIESVVKWEGIPLDLRGGCCH